MADSVALHETVHEVHRHPAPTGFIRKYIFSIDHKVIGIQYLLLAIFSVFIGLIMSVLMRVKLTWPGTQVSILEKLFPLGAPGGVMSPVCHCPNRWPDSHRRDPTGGGTPPARRRSS